MFAERCAIGRAKLVRGINPEVVERGGGKEHGFRLAHGAGLSRHAIPCPNGVGERVDPAYGTVERKKLRKPILVRVPPPASLIFVSPDYALRDRIADAD